jgi:hypothetical protein
LVDVLTDLFVQHPFVSSKSVDKKPILDLLAEFKAEIINEVEEEIEDEVRTGSGSGSGR